MSLLFPKGIIKGAETYFTFTDFFFLQSFAENVTVIFYGASPNFKLKKTNLISMI